MGMNLSGGHCIAIPIGTRHKRLAQPLTCGLSPSEGLSRAGTAIQPVYSDVNRSLWTACLFSAFIVQLKKSPYQAQVAHLLPTNTNAGISLLTLKLL
jgi:hypothetical protein